MSLSQIAAILRAHGLPAYTLGESIVTEDRYTLAGRVYCNSKTFLAGTSRADLMAWLGY